MGKFIEQHGLPFEVVEVERKAALRSVTRSIAVGGGREGKG